MRFGSLDPSSPRFDTRTDVAVGESTGAIELRLPWGLLNVTDPSSRRVLHQPTRHEGTFDTVTTGGFRIYAYATEAPGGTLVEKRLRRRPYAWEGWESPRYVRELKHGASALREAMESVDAR